jgi:dihydroneopterin aldolase
MNMPPFIPASARVTSAKVHVRDLLVQAEIGVYEHEHGRRQPLVVEVELEIEPGPFEHIADTVSYETVAERAREIAASGHLKLVETFAERLAHACLADRRVRAVRVRVDKPEALAPAVAGVEIRVERG